MSDANANLLFYCNGQQVYNANHVVMPNGSGLNSHFSAFQGSLVVPFETDSSKYFLFQLEANEVLGNFGFVYSVIDMSLDGGLGDIPPTQKNIQITAQATCEGIAATSHRNGSKAWVVQHDYNVDDFTLLQVGDTIDTILHQPSNTTYTVTGVVLKFSPNGKWFGSSLGSDSLVELYRFDNLSGDLSFVRNIDFPSRPIGIEFSSNSNQLYIACQNVDITSDQYYLYQYNLETEVLQAIDTMTRVESLQLDEERRIQLGLTQQNSLGVINAPNESGINANPADSFISITPMFLASRFPNWISNWFNTSFCVEQSCITDSAAFYFAGYKFDSLIWDFGDPSSGALNSGAGLEVKHLYPNTGLYDVTLYATTGGHTDTILQTIKIDSTIEEPLFQSDSIAFCSNETNSLNVSSDYSDYTWNTGATTSTITVDSSGWYRVTVENGCGTANDSIHVTLEDPFVFSLGDDTTICMTSSLDLNSQGNSSLNYLWSTGDSAYTITVDYDSALTNPRVLSVSVSNSCTLVKDTIKVDFVLKPSINLPPDTTQCFGGPVILSFEPQDSTYYLWSDSSSGSVLSVDTNQSVWLQASNLCGTASDTVLVKFQPEITTELGEDTLLCQGDSIILNATWSGATYEWNSSVPVDQQTDSIIGVSYDQLEQSGASQVTYLVTITDRDCQKVESITLRLDDQQCDSSDCKFSIPNVFSPNGDGLNDQLSITLTCNQRSFQVSIYNRWGQLIYRRESQGRSIFWDGYLNGTRASPGTYFIVAEDSESQTQMTTITLVE